MEANANLHAPRLLIGVTQFALVILAVVLALLLVAAALSLLVLAYFYVAFDRVPQAYEVSGALGYCAILGLILSLVLILRRIVLTATHSPFTPANAARLLRMGWIALTWQVLVAMLAATGHQINIVNQPSLFISVVDAHSYSVGGAFTVLALFVLAHVFRTGTQMDADLEGTV